MNTTTSHDPSPNSPKSSAPTGSGDAHDTNPQDDGAALALKSSVLADAHGLTDEAKHVAGDVLSHARKSAENQISSGKDRVAESLGSVADAIRSTGEQLRDADQAGLTEYVSRAANQVEAASEYLKDRSLSDVLGDVGGFARREPAMFLGGAFVLGLFGGRFLKSSHTQPRSDRETAGAEQSSGRGREGSGHKGGSRNAPRGGAHGAPSTGRYAKTAQTMSGLQAPRDLGSADGGPDANGDAQAKPGVL